jgi:TRAP-type C4-dicarboxylate transport system substrate-binding protein
VTLPGIGLRVDDNGAEAIWKWLHEEEPQKEIGALYLQAMYLPGDSTIYNSKRELKTVADFNGLRIRTLNPAWTMVLDNMKANPMTFNLPETYENIEKNVADGYVMDYSWSTTNRA